jgi:hypothetical protein
VPHKTITADQLPLAKIYPAHTVLLNCADEMYVDTLEEEQLQVCHIWVCSPLASHTCSQRIVTFVNEGGLLVTYNCALKLLVHAFPGMFQPSDRQLTESLYSSVKVASSDEPAVAV